MSWYNPATWFVDQENLDAGNRAAEKLAVLNAQDYGQGGRIYERVEAERGTPAAEDNLAIVLEHGADQIITREEADIQVVDAFESGWNDAYNERVGQAENVLRAPFKVAFDTIPWFYWAIGAGVLFFYLGGGPWLKKQLKL